MAKYCINTEDSEYRALKQSSGSPILFDQSLSKFMDEHNGAYPNTDRIQGADSTQYLKDTFKLSKYDTTSEKQVLDITNTDSLQTAQTVINQKLQRDNEVKLTRIADRIKFNIIRRPSPYEFRMTDTADVDLANSRVYIGAQLERLAQLYGIRVLTTNTQELQDSGLLERVPEYASISAFVHEGNVYVNEDVASIDAPTHEMLHILLGGIKYSHPEIYYNLVQTTQQLDNFQSLMEQMPNRALSDVCEEVFVKEYAKYLTGTSNLLNGIDPIIMSEVDYEVKRTLDTILMGDNSVQLLPNATIALSNLKNLAKLVNAHNMENTGNCFINGAYLNRIMANTKHELMKSGDLKEVCE